MVVDGKSSQEYPVNAGVPQGSILDLTLFLLYIDDHPDDVICNVFIYAYDTIFYFVMRIWSVVTTRIGSWTWIWSVRHCGLGQKMASWFQCWKNSTYFFITGLITLVLLMWKKAESVFEEKSSVKMLEVDFLFSDGLGLLHYLLLKLPPRKLEPWFVLWSFFLVGCFVSL